MKGRNVAKYEIPTIDTLLDSDAFEARMHFLLPDGNLGSYGTKPAMVSEPSAKIANAEIDREQYDELGFLMWVDFFEYEKLDPIVSAHGPRHAVQRRRVGDIALSTSRHELEDWEDLKLDGMNDFTQLWLAHYARDVGYTFFNTRRHPSPDFGHVRGRREDVVPVVQHEGTALERTVKLAQKALKESPQLEPWIRDMEIPFQKGDLIR